MVRSKKWPKSTSTTCNMPSIHLSIHPSIHPSKGYYLAIKRNEIVRGQWLAPVILATQEAEIRRIAVWKPALGK
jgi:hypothetical protein